MSDVITFQFEFSNKEIAPLVAEDDASAFCPPGWKISKVEFGLWDSSHYRVKKADGEIVRTITQWTTVVTATAVKCEA